MQKRRTWLPVLFICAVLLVVLKIDLFGKAYWRFFSDPIVGEIEPWQVRGMNKLELGKTGSVLDFIVVGHIYGGQDKEDHQPDEALRLAIPAIKQMDPDFLVSLGDMVQYSQPGDFDILEQTLLNHFLFPVFNTVGNHDVGDRAHYEARYGPTYYTFKYGPARFVFLDTEKKRCGLTKPQLEMLVESVQNVLRDDEVHTLFIFMHKTLFFKNKVLANVKMSLAQPNDWSCYERPFWIDINNILLSASTQKSVYLFAGDVGAWGNLTPYYERAAGTSLTMIMTGLGDTSEDNMIHVHVDDRQVTLEAIFLQDLSSQSIFSFDSHYWESVAYGDIQISP